LTDQSQPLGSPEDLIKNFRSQLGNFEERLNAMEMTSRATVGETQKLRHLLTSRYIVAYGTAVLTACLLAAVALSHLYFSVHDSSRNPIWPVFISEGFLVIVVGMLLCTYVATSRRDY
jgi:hypothetical protein